MSLVARLIIHFRDIRKCDLQSLAIFLLLRCAFGDWKSNHIFVFQILDKKQQGGPGENQSILKQF